jgi:RND superfamily putative drug exporter
LAWWLPRWLGRLLPNLDIEGERLPAAPLTATAYNAASPGQAEAERDAA